MTFPSIPSFRPLLISTLLILSIVGGLSLVGGTVAAEAPNGAGLNDSVVHPEIAELEDGETRDVLVHFNSSRASVQSVSEPTTTLKRNADAAQRPLLEHARQKRGITVERQFWITNAALVTVDTTETSVEELATIEGVNKVTPNFEVQTLNSTTETSYDANSTATSTSISPDSPTVRTAEPSSVPSVTYALTQLNVPDVWTDFDTRGEGVRVAVLDTGVDHSHSDIELADEHGWADFDATGNRRFTRPRDYDPYGHGTHVSGTVAGGNASGRYIGVAPDAELMHGAVMTENCASGCRGTTAQILAGMEWAVQNDADVMSMSLGGAGYNPYYIDAVRNSRTAGTTVVAASGNLGVETSASPGNVYESISVGATNRYGSVPTFSSGERIDTTQAWGWYAPGDWPDEYIVPDVVAPGTYVTSAEPGGTYGQKSGTSMATPHVAGVVALMQSSTDEHLSPAEIDGALTETAQAPTDAPEGKDIRYGHGTVDAYTAVTSVSDDLSIRASLETYDGTPIETGVVMFVDTESNEVIATESVDESGAVSAVITETDAVDLIYYRTDSELKPVPYNGAPAVYAIDRVTDESDGDLGTVRFPEPHPVRTAVATNNGEPVSGATVVFTHAATSGSEGSLVLETDSAGRASYHEDEPGITYLSGEITANVSSPESKRFENTTYTDTFVVDNQIDFNTTIQETPVVKDATRDVTDATVAPGNSTNVSIALDIARSGSVELTERVDNTSVSITDPSLEGAPIKEGNVTRTANGLSTNLSVTGNSRSSRTAYLNYSLTVSDSTTANQSLTFDGSVSDRAETMSVSGTTEIWIGNKSFEQTYLRNIADDDGVIRTDGLRRGIDDWRNGTIDIDLLRKVIAAWRTG